MMRRSEREGVGSVGRGGGVVGVSTADCILSRTDLPNLRLATRTDELLWVWYNTMWHGGKAWARYSTMHRSGKTWARYNTMQRSGKTWARYSTMRRLQYGVLSTTFPTRVVTGSISAARCHVIRGRLAASMSIQVRCAGGERARDAKTIDMLVCPGIRLRRSCPTYTGVHVARVFTVTLGALVSTVPTAALNLQSTYR